MTENTYILVGAHCMNLQIHQFSDQSGPIFKRLDLGPGGELERRILQLTGVLDLVLEYGCRSTVKMAAEAQARLDDKNG